MTEDSRLGELSVIRSEVAVWFAHPRSKALLGDRRSSPRHQSKVRDHADPATRWELVAFGGRQVKSVSRTGEITAGSSRSAPSVGLDIEAEMSTQLNTTARSRKGAEPESKKVAHTTAT